jgi:diguanylate cyclase (GGDEF)-like protein
VDDRRYRFDPTTARAAGRLGSILVAGLSAALGAICLVGVDTRQVDEEAGLVAAGIGLAVALVAWVAPWHRLWRWSPLVLPLGTAAGLVAVDAVTELSRSPEGLAFYPTAWFVLLVWVGLTRSRWTTLAISPVVVASALAVTLPEASRIPVEAVAVVIPAGVVLGEAVAWALAGIRLGQRIERRREQDIRLLAGSVGQLRSQRSTIEETADLLARLAHEVFHGDHVTVVLHSQDGRLVPASLGAPESAPSERVGDLVAQAIHDAEVRLVAENGTTLLIIPLVGESEIGGAIVVRQPRTGDDPFTQQLAVLFASQAGPALEQLRIIDRLSEDLRRDELTDIGNFRHARALVASLTPGDAVVLIDLDNLKVTNDTYGHEAGNQLLRELSDLLRSSVREADLVARYGGDEFVLVARTAELDAVPAANRLLESWRRSGPNRSFSAGVAIHHRDDLTDLTLEHADQALYRAKRAGRNQICLYPPGGWTEPGQPRDIDLRPRRRRDDEPEPEPAA